ncbi:MAG: hypothetical protein LBV41_12875 [Cytophagaceae bacterium]|jgi:hypothetical protein|nr:hypothetical protein [Cytophagaceae bacterium]
MNLNNIIRENVRAELEALKRRIAENIVSTGRQASGRTAQSLEVTETERGGMLTGRRAFHVLETGRAGGKVPYGFTGIILQWMRDKGIKAEPMPYLRKASDKWQPKYTAQERGDMSLAGAIAHKIRTEGTALFHKGGSDDVYSREIPKTIEAIYSKIADNMAIDIIKSIKLNTK